METRKIFFYIVLLILIFGIIYNFYFFKEENFCSGKGFPDVKSFDGKIIYCYNFSSDGFSGEKFFVKDYKLWLKEVEE